MWRKPNNWCWHFCFQKLTRENVFLFQFAVYCFSICMSVFALTINPPKHLWVAPTVSFSLDLELLAQLHAALSDITDVVGKYGFAVAELMWQVSITEFHCQQCCSLWESIHCELWYLTLLECPEGLLKAAPSRLLIRWLINKTVLLIV